MTSYEKVVVIGLWRQGNSWKTISSLMGITVINVKKIIKDYLKSIK